MKFKSKTIVVVIPILILFSLYLVNCYSEKNESKKENIESKDEQIERIDSLSLDILQKANILIDNGSIDSAFKILNAISDIKTEIGNYSNYKDSVDFIRAHITEYYRFAVDSQFKDILKNLSENDLERLHNNKYSEDIIKVPPLNDRIMRILYENRKNINKFKNEEMLEEKAICSAALTAIMGYEKYYKYHSTYSENGNRVFVFRSPNSNYDLEKCYIDGNRIIWGVKKAKGINDGRWRNDPRDEKLFYKLEGDKLIINEIYPDGSKSEWSYSLKYLKRMI